MLGICSFFLCSKLKKQEASAGSDKLVLLWRVVKASSGKLNTPDLLLCLDGVGKVEKFRYFQHNSDHPSIVRQFWEWNAYMKAPHCPCFSKRENTACRAGILWLLKEDNYLITVRRLARDNALSSCWNNSRVTSSIWQKTKVPSTLQPNLKLITSSIPLVDVFLKILQKFVSLFNPFLAVSCMPGWQLGLALWRCRRKGCLAAIKVVLKHRFMIGQESKDTPRKTVSDYRAFLLENNNVLAKLMIYRKIWVRQLRAYPWEWWQNGGTGCSCRL